MHDKILKTFWSAIAFCLMFFSFLAAIFCSGGKKDQEQIRSDYGIKQAQHFNQTIFAEMTNDFTSPSDDAQQYSKNKSNTFKKMLLEKKLEKNDLNALMQIYKKDPTKVNKIYVIACAWNNKYDRNNLTKYGKYLNYYTQHLTKQDKKLISPYLQKIIDSCSGDPTGEAQKPGLLDSRPETPMVVKD